jgi:hypothetical protein
MITISFARHQFPPAVIRHAVWLCIRFTLSYRDVEELLAERGLEVSYETVRRWVLKFGPLFARELRRRRSRPTAPRERDRSQHDAAIARTKTVARRSRHASSVWVDRHVRLATAQCAPVPIIVRHRLTTSNRRRSKLVRTNDPSTFADEALAKHRDAGQEEICWLFERKSLLKSCSPSPSW